MRRMFRRSQSLRFLNLNLIIVLDRRITATDKRFTGHQASHTRKASDVLLVPPLSLDNIVS